MAILFFCAVAFAAGIVADELGHIVAHHVRRRLRAWRKAQPGYQAYQRLLREQSRSRMAAIMAETDNPWAAPRKEAGRE